MANEKAFFIFAVFAVFVAFSQIVTSPDKKYKGISHVADENLKQTLIDKGSITTMRNDEVPVDGKYQEWDTTVRPYLEDPSFNDFKFETKYTDPNEVVPLLPKNGSDNMFMVDSNASLARDAHISWVSRGNNHHMY